VLLGQFDVYLLLVLANLHQEKELVLNTISILDLASFLTILTAFAMLLSGWKRSLSRDAKLLIAGILILSLFHHLSDFLQWSGIYDKLDAIEDYPGMLQPLLWLFLLYAMIKQVAFKDLHSSEERLRRVVENMPVMMIAFDGDWNFALWNSECEHVTGYTPEEMIDNPHAMGTLFPDLKYLRYVKKTYKEFKNDIRNQEWKITCKDGTVKIIIWSDISRRFPIAGWSMWSIGIDVSSRVNTEKALRESDEKYRALIEQSGDAIYLLTDSKYELINQQFAKLFKISVDEALAPDFDLMTLIAPQSRELITERAAMAKRGERLSSHCEFTGLTKDGKEIEIEASVSHLIRDGKLTTQGVLHDITERKQADRELRESEAKYRELAEMLPEAVFETDLQGDFKFANRKVLEYFGYEEADLDNGLSVFDMLHHDDRGKARNRFQQLLKGEQIGETEYRGRRADGSYFPISVHSAVVTKHGNVTGIRGIIVDITHRKQAEKRLQELAAYPESNPNPVLTICHDTTVAYMNPTCRRIVNELGLKDKDIKEILPVNLQGIVTEMFPQVTNIHNLESSCKGNSWLWTLHQVKGQDLIHCYATNITDRIKKDQERRKLSAAVAQSENIVVITDVNGSIEYVNPKFVKTTGYALMEVIGKYPKVLKSGKHDDEFFKNLWETITLGDTWSGNIRNRKKNGDLYWERKIISPIFNEKRQIIGFLSIGEDITSELIMQQQVVEADKMKAIGMLAAGVAHEFKNYLGGIIGNASFALTDLDTEQGPELARDTFNQIIELGERANEVAMSLLTYSKAKPEDFSETSLESVITRSIGLIDKEMTGLAIDIVTYFDDIPDMAVSASKIQQLLMNLLINAQHAIGSQGVITVGLTRDDDSVKIRVADTGCGISEKAMPKIFDPFFSTKGVWGKDEVVGTGMGLSICRNIAREHGGDITVDSRPNMGTCFTLTLPLPQKSRRQPGKTDIVYRGTRVMVFTLEKAIISHYFKTACELDVRLIPLDDITKIQGDLNSIADLVICDAKLVGKLELYRLAKMADDGDIPYAMVNCGAMEYQLDDVYRNASATCSELDDLKKILDIATERRSSTSDHPVH
jgi:PAS domain S-box-containing protein